MRAGPVICLVGMPGSGKSTVGALVAERLGARFVDLDVAVTDRAGRTVAEIFEAEGEAGFRARELAELAVLVEVGERVVVATGGGIVTTAEARDLLAGTTCIWLETDPATLVARLRRDTSVRPLLADDLAGSIDRLSSERDDLYRTVAQHIVVTTDDDPADLADAVIEQLTRVAG